MKSLDELAIVINTVNRHTIVNTRLRDLDRPDAGHDRTTRQMSVADDHPVAILVDKLFVRFDPGGHLSLHSLGQQSLRTDTQHVGQHILGSCGWHRQ